MPTLMTPECSRVPATPYGRATQEPKFRRDFDGQESRYIVNLKTGQKLWYSPTKKRWTAGADFDEA